MDFIVQFVAAGMLLYGLWEMGNKSLRGPALAAVSEALWVGTGLLHEMWGLIFLSVVLVVVQCRNFLKWRSEGASW